MIWGTGLLKPVPADFLDRVELAALRGPVSESLLGVTAPALGDPGLLADRVVDAPARGDRIGLVPHYAQLADPRWRALAEAHPVLDLIDVRGDAAAVTARIASCAHVVSSSLHGLVVADAFGVPNTWLDPAGIHAAAKLKFLDYAAGIERALPAPLDPDALPGMLGRLPQGDLPHGAGVARAKEALACAFPAHLRAGRIEEGVDG